MYHFVAVVIIIDASRRALSLVDVNVIPLELDIWEGNLERQPEEVIWAGNLGRQYGVMVQ